MCWLVSTWHRLKSPGKRGPQRRNCLHCRPAGKSVGRFVIVNLRRRTQPCMGNPPWAGGPRCIAKVDERANKRWSSAVSASILSSRFPLCVLDLASFDETIAPMAVGRLGVQSHPQLQAQGQPELSESLSLGGGGHSGSSLYSQHLRGGGSRIIPGKWLWGQPDLRETPWNKPNKRPTCTQTW